MSIRKLAITWISLKFVAFIFLELVLRQGLWTRWLDNNLPAYIANSGSDWQIVFSYVTWMFAEPIIIGIALIAKDRPVLLKHS